MHSILVALKRVCMLKAPKYQIAPPNANIKMNVILLKRYLITSNYTYYIHYTFLYKMQQSYSPSHRLEVIRPFTRLLFSVMNVVSVVVSNEWIS